ncbi:hypothetical protein HK104_008972 [Borealophlyctis nickersoniae]|nr:hypothetical protein HK104_008972 [Borealophlyctis nickersoniae]
MHKLRNFRLTLPPADKLPSLLEPVIAVMKRSNDYGTPQPVDSNYKKQRFSPQGPYGYPLASSSGAAPGMGFGGSDLYGQFGSMGQYMNALAGMGGMAGLAGHQQQGSGGLGQYQGMGPGQYQSSQYSPGSFSQYQAAATAQYQAAQAAANAQYQASSAYANGLSSLAATMRTVYLGNLPSPIIYEEVINHIKGGPLEQVKILEEKNCAFVTFIYAADAQTYYQDAQSKHLYINNQEVKIGWGKHSSLPANVLAAVSSGASRNVFVGNIDETLTDQVLAQEFGKFGPIDQIKILPDKRIAFVHMASVTAAMKAVSTLPNDPRWASRRINYGKDRCAYNQKASASSSSSSGSSGSVLPFGYAGGFNQPVGMGYGGMSFDPFNGGSGSMTNGQASPPGSNRTVYLGGIHPDVTTKDLCDVIRGGILQNIKYMPDKNIAFVTFIDPSAAVAFYNRGTFEGVVLKGKRLKVGWGKAVPLPATVAGAVQAGASRNVYIGAIDETVTEDRLRKDFSDFGDIELVNIIPDKNIGFVNFIDILSAVKAVETMKTSHEYSKYKINYGKDRCGNPPRPPRESAAHRAASVLTAPPNDVPMGLGGDSSPPSPNGISVREVGSTRESILTGAGILASSGSFM